MKKSLIVIYSGDYSNGDAYERLLTYVSKKNYVCGYGIPIPIERNYAIQSFYQAQDLSTYTCTRQLWHFTISLPDKTDLVHFMQLADHIAILFGYQYQVVYALDLEKPHAHIHFAINCYSHLPEQPPLSEELFQSYLAQSISLLQSYYPQYKASVEWKEEGDENV